MRKAIIKTAENMSDETFSILTEGIKKKFGGNIEFEKITDDSVIGGFVLELDGIVHDLSVSSQLKRVKKHISK